LISEVFYRLEGGGVTSFASEEVFFTSVGGIVQ
jgi:hypothetical protein